MPIRRPWRYWARIVVGVVIGSALVVLTFNDAALHLSLRRFAEGMAVSLVFGLTIGLLMGVAMPRVAPWLWRRLPSPLQWIAVVLTMVAFASAGSVVAILM